MVSQLRVTMASYIVVPCSWGSYLIVVLKHVCCDSFHTVSTSETTDVSLYAVSLE